MEIPDFIGWHDVAFTDGSLQILELFGAVHTSMGLPLYLLGEDRKVYNYSNVIYTRKREANGR